MNDFRPTCRRAFAENGQSNSGGERAPIAAGPGVNAQKTGEDVAAKGRLVPFQAGEDVRVRLEAKSARAITGANMRELANIGADIEDDALQAERKMAPDAVFAFEPVEARRPTPPVKFLAPRRRHGDPRRLDADKNPLGALFQADIDIADDLQRGQHALTDELQALGERQLQKKSRGRRPSAILCADRPVTPGSGGRK